jgi:hypothetical protein
MPVIEVRDLIKRFRLTEKQRADLTGRNPGLMAWAPPVRAALLLICGYRLWLFGSGTVREPAHEVRYSADASRVSGYTSAPSRFRFWGSYL